MKVYKLTDQNMQTHNGFQWELGVEKTTGGSGDLCSSGWLHAYTDPLLAVLLNPIHANFQNPKLFVAEGKGESKSDRGLKVGYTSLTLIEEMAIPEISHEQRVRFAIFCAKEVCKNTAWNKWADDWLSEKDRTSYAAAAAAAAAAYAADGDAAYAAAYAADAYAYAAYAADAYAYAAYAAAYAAEADAYAAYAAASAAAANVDLIARAHKAMEEV